MSFRTGVKHKAWGPELAQQKLCFKALENMKEGKCNAKLVKD